MRSDLPDGWDLRPIGSIADVIGGGTPSTRDPTNFGGEVPWLTPKDLSAWSSRFVSCGERSLSTRGLKRSAARLLPRRAVLVSSRAPIGYVALAANPVSTNQGFRSLVLKDGHVPEFFYYVMRTMKPTLEANASGSTFKEITGSQMKLIAVPVPPPAEQERIASVLGVLDEKIDSNRRLARLLEQIARTEFQSRFAGHLGGAGRLGDHVEVIRGRSYKSSELLESDSALVTLKSVRRGGGYSPDGLKPYVGEFKSQQVIEPGELVVTQILLKGQT